MWILLYLKQYTFFFCRSMEYRFVRFDTSLAVDGYHPGCVAGKHSRLQVG